MIWTINWLNKHSGRQINLNLIWYIISITNNHKDKQIAREKKSCQQLQKQQQTLTSTKNNKYKRNRPDRQKERSQWSGELYLETVDAVITCKGISIFIWLVFTKLNSSYLVKSLFVFCSLAVFYEIQLECTDRSITCETIDLFLIPM